MRERGLSTPGLEQQHAGTKGSPRRRKAAALKHSRCLCAPPAAAAQATGYGGAVGQATGIEDKLRRRAESPDAALEAKAAARELRVWFSSDVADDMPWRFTPTQVGAARRALGGRAAGAGGAGARRALR